MHSLFDRNLFGNVFYGLWFLGDWTLGVWNHFWFPSCLFTLSRFSFFSTSFLPIFFFCKPTTQKSSLITNKKVCYNTTCHSFCLLFLFLLSPVLIVHLHNFLFTPPFHFRASFLFFGRFALVSTLTTTCPFPTSNTELGGHNWRPLMANLLSVKRWTVCLSVTWARHKLLRQF